jgi:hypothetical protein
MDVSVRKKMLLEFTEDEAMMLYRILRNHTDVSGDSDLSRFKTDLSDVLVTEMGFDY